ncbi:hypothetical protein INT47_000370 [Mucor saturninus]|uniref:Uncharacterized protein n=1 Tax=Mucor saturninus TaxID=64648 RepID=A0A8H7QF17_9FUNG|nr:hypothetical protein INT47_000370 [Mucor saturninus]
MICKHFGKYRAAKNGEGCSAFVYIHKDVKLAGKLWTVRSSCLEHSNPLSEDKRAYHNNRKLNADDQESVITLMRGGTTPSKTLKMLETKGVRNLIVTDLTNIQQQFCRDSHTDMWNFVKNLESSGHQVRFLTDADE